MDEVKIRPARESDKPFIFSSWLKSYREDSLFAKQIRNSVFYPNHRKLVEHLLDKSITRIAYPGGEDDLIIGFITGLPPETLHYVFVKEHWRGLKMAKALLESLGFNQADGFQFSHRTRSFEAKFKIDQTKLIYNPYAL